MRVLAIGQPYDVRMLHCDGFRNAKGLPVDATGYCWRDFFDKSGRYLGPDVYGIEPAFMGWGDFGFSPGKRN